MVESTYPDSVTVWPAGEVVAAVMSRPSHTLAAPMSPSLFQAKMEMLKVQD